MTEEEIEAVAQELARMSGTSWYPGREKGSLTLVLMDRYRDRARAAIAALDRYRENQAASRPNGNTLDRKHEGNSPPEPWLG